MWRTIIVCNGLTSDRFLQWESSWELNLLENLNKSCILTSCDGLTDIHHLTIFWSEFYTEKKIMPKSHYSTLVLIGCIVDCGSWCVNDWKITVTNWNDPFYMLVFPIFCINKYLIHWKSKSSMQIMCIKMLTSFL